MSRERFDSGRISHRFSPYRELIDHAETSGERAFYHIGEILWDVQNHVEAAFERGEKPAELISNSLGRLRASRAHVVDLCRAVDTPTTPENYVRKAYLYRDLIAPIILLPTLFRYHTKNHQAAAARVGLIRRDHLFKTLLRHLKEVWVLRNTAQFRHDDQESIGLVAELTSLGLLNYDDSGKMVALPTLPEPDVQQKIDIVGYRHQSGQRARAVFQVKATAYVPEAIQGIPTLSGADIGNNSYNSYWGKLSEMQTTRALVALGNKRATEQQIAGIRHFAAKLRTRQRAQNIL